MHRIQGSSDPRIQGSLDSRIQGSLGHRIQGSLSPRIQGSFYPRILGSSNPQIIFHFPWVDGCVGKHVSKESFFNFRFPVENVSKPFESTGVTLACEGQGAHKMVLSSTNATGHQHHWCKEPPEGRLYFSKTFYERYGDDEGQWRTLTLWILQAGPSSPSGAPPAPGPGWWSWCCHERRRCSRRRCSRRWQLRGSKRRWLSRKRAVMLRHKHLPRRGGEGQASRRRRMLAYQLKLIERLGLPLSRLLKKTDAMSQRGKARRLEEEVKVKEEEEEEEVIVQKKEEKEEGFQCNSEEASTGGSTIFTPRSFQSDVFPPSSQPFPQVLGVPFPSSFSTPPCAPYFSPPQCGQTPWPQWVICGSCQSWGTVLPCAALSWDASAETIEMCDAWLHVSCALSKFGISKSRPK